MKLRPLGILFVITLIVQLSCVPEERWEPPDQALAYRPVYGSPNAGEIKLVSSRQVKNPGKIYVYGKYLLVNEINQGIHIFNNESPDHPQPVAFIQMLGNSDMAIKNARLYADHSGNIVSVSINDFQSIELQASLVIHNWDLGVPPPSGSRFECVDPSKGKVIDWKKTELSNPGCYALY
jgi:hypothetical protein